VRSGERSLAVPEQLGEREVGAQRAAVDREERSLARVDSE